MRKKNAQVNIMTCLIAALKSYSEKDVAIKDKTDQDINISLRANCINTWEACHHSLEGRPISTEPLLKKT
jgi:hypothetical protein